MIVAFSLVLAACSPGATAPQPPDLSNLDPADLAIDASGIDVIAEGETTFIDSNGVVYALFFESAKAGFSPEYTDYTVSWSKYDWDAEAWSLWQTFKLSDVGENYLIPDMKLVDDYYTLKEGEAIISGSYSGEAVCLFEDCLINTFQLWLEFSAGKGG